MELTIYVDNMILLFTNTERLFAEEEVGFAASAGRRLSSSWVVVALSVLGTVGSETHHSQAESGNAETQRKLHLGIGGVAAGPPL